jgi:cytochrome c oxidase cbb3-type subunit 2
VAGVFPPLAGDPVVLDPDPADHIRVILEGAQGSTIAGVTYAAAMPGFGRQLGDEEIALLVNHERSNWGNDAPLVTPEDVARVRSGS